MTEEELRLYAFLLAERIEGEKATSADVLIAAEQIYEFLNGGPLRAKH